jgi:hypothetical protein
MPVVEKITKMIDDGEIRTNGIGVDQVWNFVDARITLPMCVIYKTVVEFITWYNLQPNQ